MSASPASPAAPLRRSSHNTTTTASTAAVPARTPPPDAPPSLSSSSSSSSPALPPYTPAPGLLPVFPVASAAAAATTATTTQRKTVRFQTDRDDNPGLSRTKPAGLRERHSILSLNGGGTRTAAAGARGPSGGGSAGGGGASLSSMLARPHQPTAASNTTAPSRNTPPPSLYGGEDAGPLAGGGGGSGGGDGHNAAVTDHHHGRRADDEKVVRPTLLQPRVAVVLGLPSLWHLPLFACRLLSVCPAIWWSLGIVVRLLVQLHALALPQGGRGGWPGGGGSGGSSNSSSSSAGGALSLDNRLRLTETALAMIWCGVSAYLSFFFTDCLMSRWLLNYTPQATIVRLLAINAVNGYLTSCVIYLAGGGSDARLLLPAWIGIAAILTGLYHVTQRKINIRKETSISISVFSGASFISMVSLLAQLYWDRPGYVDVPLVSLARRVCAETARIAGHVFDIDTGQLGL